METPQKAPRAPRYTRGVHTTSPVPPGHEGPPQEIHKAPSAEGGTLELNVWGRGTMADPYALTFRHKSPQAPNRFPTYEELQDALAELLPDGVVIQMPALDVNPGAWDQGQELLADATSWTALFLFQVGVRPGSPAASRGGIIQPPGGQHGRPGA